jgi:hypothetical protein
MSKGVAGASAFFSGFVASHSGKVDFSGSGKRFWRKSVSWVSLSWYACSHCP